MLLQVVRSVRQEARGHYWLCCQEGWPPFGRRLRRFTSAAKLHRLAQCITYATTQGCICRKRLYIMYSARFIIVMYSFSSTIAFVLANECDVLQHNSTRCIAYYLIVLNMR